MSIIRDLYAEARKKKLKEFQEKHIIYGDTMQELSCQCGWEEPLGSSSAADHIIQELIFVGLMKDPDPTPKSGPWTSHGHAIKGVTVDGTDRPPVARCGGPGVCNQCSREAMAIINSVNPD